jgi:hypothetical protein
MMLRRRLLCEVTRNLFFFSGGGTYVTRYCGQFWPIVQPQMIDKGDKSHLTRPGLEPGPPRWEASD